MKKTKRIIGLLLIVVLITSTIPSAFVFGAGLGESLFESSIDIGEKITLAKGVYWNTNYKEKITENYIEYIPGNSVKPIISHGNDIYGAASFKTVTNMAEAQGRHVVAGFNGDYFDMSTGVPLGITIKEGLILNSESISRPSLGFFSDGSLIMGRPNVKISASGDSIGTGFSALNYNKAITDATGVVLYTRVFGNDYTNKAKIPTYNVLIEVDRDEIKINDYIEGTVVEAQESTGATFIPPGHVLLSISLSTQYTGSLSRLMGANHGDSISFKFEADPSWNDVEYAVGAGAMLVENGEPVTPADKEIHPRTAVGIRADGSAVFYTVDGRQAGHSKGLSLEELAKRMIELGCVEAVNMDGGGSTAIHGIYPGEDSIGVINKPSESSLRNCANYILLINTASPVGSASQLHIYPYQAKILAGSEVSFQVKASDANYYSVSAPSQLSFAYTGSIGSLEKADKDYLFKAGKTKTKGTITINSGSKVKGSANVEIVDKPDTISILNEGTGKSVSSVSLFSGEQVNLKAEATHNRMSILSSDKAYTWTVSGDVGSIDEEGVFTAAEINKGSGQITATVNGVTASINVAIQSEGWLVESFEGKDNFFKATAAGAGVIINKDLTKVKYGYQSALLEYDFDLAQSTESPEKISFPIKANFTKAPKMIGFYLYGDGSGNDVDLEVGTSGGKQILKAANMDFKGWKLVTVSLASGVTSLDGINILKTGKSKGSIYLDQFVAGIGFYVDTEAPVITMSVTEGWLTATVKDETDASISSSNIKLTLDGRELDFQFNINNGVLQKELPVNDGKLHRLAVEASDETGNIARMSIGFKAAFYGDDGAVDSQADIFIDTKGHWAKENIEYLYRMGIVNGSGSPEGLKFNPNKSITRAEFAVLMTNWIGEKAEAYVGTDLPFIDASAIPAWALNSVQAMYGMGMIAGTSTAKGLAFNPTGSISRQEVMTIIGRTQARGYGEASLTAFTDNKDVADWALPYVSSLVKQRVVSGSGGKLNPKSPVTKAEVSTIITGLN